MSISGTNMVPATSLSVHEEVFYVGMNKDSKANGKKSAKEISEKATAAVDAVKGTTRAKIDAGKDTAAYLAKKVSVAPKGIRDKSTSVSNTFKASCQDIKKDIHHAAKGVSDKVMK